MRKLSLIALALAAALSLSACGELAGLMTTTQAVAVKAEQNSKPRQRVATLADVLKSTKDGLAAEFTAGRLTKVDFVATEPGVMRAQVAITEAGDLLKAADDDRKLAATALAETSKGKYAALAAAKEAWALKKADDAELDITPLREILDRSRGVPVVVPAPVS